MKGLGVYDSPSKSDHRNWAWNRIVERLRKPTAEATAIYLVGPDDKDREVATKKGFDTRNLIAVDNNPVNIETARKHGGIGICGDIGLVLATWNNGPLDVVFLDTCSTFMRCAGMINDGLLSDAIDHNTILYCNVQRGREKATCNPMEFRKWLGPHRGKWIVTCEMIAYVETLHRNRFHSINRVGLTQSHVAWLLPHIAPAYSTYRGSKVTMDSVVFRSLPGNESHNYNHPVFDLPKFKKQKRRMAALKAIRTKALQGAAI